eukprot:5509595-Prorocentrum_lima.AAC.1
MKLAMRDCLCGLRLAVSTAVLKGPAPRPPPPSGALATNSPATRLRSRGARSLEARSGAPLS